MSTYYPISTPVQFKKELGITGAIKFNATGSNENRIQDFVTTNSGDMVYCITGSDNYLERLPIGTLNQYLKVSPLGLPTWTTLESMNVIKGSTSVINMTGTFLPISSGIIGGWTGTNMAGTGGTAYSAFDVNPFNYSTGILTIPATGVYNLYADILFIQSTNTGVRREIAFVLSPSPGPGTILARNNIQPPSSTTAVNMITINYQGIFNAGDTIAIEAGKDGGTIATFITIQIGSRWGITKIN